LAKLKRNWKAPHSWKDQFAVSKLSNELKERDHNHYTQDHHICNLKFILNFWEYFHSSLEIMAEKINVFQLFLNLWFVVQKNNKQIDLFDRHLLDKDLVLLAQLFCMVQVQVLPQNNRRWLNPTKPTISWYSLLRVFQQWQNVTSKESLFLFLIVL